MKRDDPRKPFPSDWDFLRRIMRTTGRADEQPIAAVVEFRRDAESAERESIIRRIARLERHGVQNTVTGDRFWAFRESDITALIAAIRKDAEGP